MRKLAIFVAMLLVGSAALGAQETTGAIQGRVVDAQGLAVPGTNITISGPQGMQTVATDNEGRFNVSFLTPGTYTVRAELQGFKAAEQQGVMVGLGQTANVPLTLQVGGVTEVVQVTSAPDIIDTRTTTVGGNLSSEMLQRLPVGRTVSAATYLIPGVSSSGTAGAANPSIGGGSGLDNHYVIDGVNVTNQGFGALGSYSIIFGSLGNATPFDFIQEVQVKTSGYQAEFGQALGGVVNVITKSGSNTLRGSLFGYARPSNIEDTWRQYQSENGSVQTTSSQTLDGGAEVGFPIVRDRLFLFAAYDPGRDVRTFQAPAGFPLQTLGKVDRIRNTNTYAVKGTWQVSGDHRIDASFFGDPSSGKNGPQRGDALSSIDTSKFSSLDYGGHNQTVRYSGALTGSWLVEANFARALNSLVEAPSVNTWQVRDTTVTPNVRSGGLGLYEAETRGVNYQYTARATNLIGNHQIRYGGEFNRVNYDVTNNRTGPTFLAPDGRQTATGAQISIIADPALGQFYRVTRANYNLGRPTTQKYANFFVQDSWQIGNRLTINPGIRYEQETMDGVLVKGFSLKNNWAPRFGATFDATGDGRTKVYGSYGRFYQRVPNDLAARALSADDGISRADYFDAALTRPIPNGTTAGGVTNHFVLAGASPDTIDPKAKLGYTDDFSIGVQREILRYTSLSISYTFRNVGRVLEDVAAFPVAAYDLGLPGTASVEYILTNPSASTPVAASAAALGAHFDDPVHKYHAVELTLDRRFANNWSLLASYRWSRLRGNFEGAYRDDNGQSDPGITSLYDFPTNDPSYTAIGVPQFGYRGDIRFLGDPNGILPLDRPHQIKVYGSYLFPFGVNVGAGLNLGSGAPLTPLAAHPNYSNGGEIPEAPRGSGIQTVDGFRTRAPFQKQVDLQASYNLRLGGNKSVTLLADVFNLFNSQTVLMYDQWTQLSGPAPNPDFGAPVSKVLLGAPPQFQAPRQIRVGARFGF